MRTHQKHPFGYQNIKLYIENKFKTPKGFENLVYVSQLMQADAIKTAIEAHRSKIPYNTGTMFWQWNDCWPVVSWSAVDYYGGKKALFYEVKRKYAEDFLAIDPSKNFATFYSDKDYSFEVAVSLSVYDLNGKQLSKMQDRVYWYNHGSPLKIDCPALKDDQLNNSFWVMSVKQGNTILVREIFFKTLPKELQLQKAQIKLKLITGNRLELITDKFAYGVFVELPDGVEADDNFFHLLPKEKKTVQLSRSVNINQIKIRSLADTY
jgi:beta-mannosidase